MSHQRWRPSRPVLFFIALMFTLTVPPTRASREAAQAPGRPATDARALHDAALVFTGHEHITNRVYFEGIDPWKAQPVGVWDYAKAKQGGVDVVIENIWAEDIYNDYNVTPKQVMRLLETFFQVLDRNRDKMELALTPADIQRIVAGKKMAVVLGLEAGWDFEGDLDVLRLLHRFGLRLAQFSSHGTTNTYADASVKKWGGINDKGRAIIREMNRLGVIIDISHASNEAQLQIIEASAAPVTNSHQGLRHFVDRGPTMPDETLKALARKGGVLGLHASASQISPTYGPRMRGRTLPGNRPLPVIAPRSRDEDYGRYITELDAAVKTRWLERYVKPWQELVPDDAPGPTIGEWVDQVDYVIKLVGEDHIAMGFDMSRGGGYLRDFDATKYPLITEALVRKGYSEQTIRKILGGNWLRLLGQARVARSEPTSR
jgi:membrane dipeptidase